MPFLSSLESEAPTCDMLLLYKVCMSSIDKYWTAASIELVPKGLANHHLTPKIS